MVTVHLTSKPVAAQQATVAPSATLRIPINNVRVGDYTAQIKIGSQGVVANVILDTGSSTFAIAPGRYQIDQDTDVKVTPLAQIVTYGTGGWSGPVIVTTVSMGSAGRDSRPCTASTVLI
jgi:hypothetical protein